MKNNLYSKGISSIFIVIIVVIVVAIGGVGVYYVIQMRSSDKETPKMDKEIEKTVEEVVEEEEIPENESTIDKAWRIYNQLSIAAENQDAEKFDSFFYLLYMTKKGNIKEQIQMCQDRMGLSESECWAALKNAMIEWKEKADFVKTFTKFQEDSHQIVLAGHSQTADNRFRLNYLFFVKDPQNQEKIYLLMSSYIAQGDTLGEIQDSDNDGYGDEKETCLRPVSSCVKTNPNLKDTDGDGWWDSIEGGAGTDPNDANSHLFN